MEYTYPAIVAQDTAGWLVLFPDLDGLSVNGDTEASATAAAKQALDAYLYAIKLQGASLPKPTNVADINANAILQQYDLPCIPGTADIKEITTE